MSAPIEFAGYRLGPDRPCFIIAEAGVNHNGDETLAARMVEAAAAAGCDAVKFQTFKSERLAAQTAPLAEYQAQATGEQGSQADMLRRLELNTDAHRRLSDCARKHDILFLSTPFDEQSADLLHQLYVPAFKVSSGDLTNLPLLRHMARLGPPLLLSTGMATLGEVEEAVRAIDDEGGMLCLLHCVSNYPADPADANLRAMETLGRAFGKPVGYSDHTPGWEVAVAAVALGACVVEKHFTPDRRLPGPDHAASLEPDELADMVRRIRTVERALGDGVKRPTRAEMPHRVVGRRSLHWASNLPAGSIVGATDVIALRPGAGVSPARLGDVVEQHLRRPVVAGTLVRWGDLEQAG